MEKLGIKWVFALLAVIIVLMTVFRPRASVPPNPDAEVITFSFWGSYEEWAMWREIVAGFHEKNPDIYVRLRYIPERYDDKLRLELAADSAADVVLIQDEPFPGYVKYGKFVDLTERVYGDDVPFDLDADFWPTSAESFIIDKHVYGVPIWGGNVLVFYNRTMFEDMGIDPPDDNWTFDEFVTLARELTRDTNGDGRLDTFGFSLPSWWVYSLPWIWGMNASFLDDSRTEWLFTDDHAVAATAFLQDLRYKYHVSPSIIDVPNREQEDVMFMTGKIGMCVSGPWSGVPWTAAGVKFDAVHVPVGPAGKRFTRVTWDALSMTKSCQNPEAAWRFMTYCLSEEAQIKIGGYVRSIPALIEGKNGFIKPDNGWHEEKFVEAMSYARLQPISEHWHRMDEIIRAEFELLLLDKQTPQDTVDAITEEIQKANLFEVKH